MRWTVKSTVCVAGCGLAGGLCGCAGFEEPRVTLTDVTVRERAEGASVVSLTLEADNPNEDSLPLREVSYEVMVDGVPVFSATRSPETTLRRFGTQRVTVPAVMPAGVDPSRVAVRGTLVYTAPGQIAEILFDAGLRRPAVSFAGEAAVSAGPTGTP